MTLFDICESCANGRIATHIVDFRDGGRVFLTCQSCADEAVERGLAVASPIPPAGEAS